MNDHVSAATRLDARDKPVVCIAMPNWTAELLLCLVVVMGVAIIFWQFQLYTVKRDLRDSQEVAEFWRELALAPETSTTVRIEQQGAAFHCQIHNVRREWELAVGAECQVLGRLLQLARSTP